MTDASIKGLEPRSLRIFHELVTAYLEDGLPIGSSRLAKSGKFDFSPASIRSKMSDLEDAGLLFAPHTSSGRIPTETGLRLFVDGLMEFNRDIPVEQRQSIDSECATRGISINQLVAMTRAANYMNSKLKNSDMISAAGLIRNEIVAHKVELDDLTTELVEQGLGIWSDGIGGDDAALILRGQANLLEDLQTADGLVEIRDLFDALEAKENALRLLDATRDGDGVKIFIGAENKLFASTGCSLVIAPYRNANQSIIGAIGVLGPRHMNYARIIPMVDYTSKAIDRVLGH